MTRYSPYGPLYYWHTLLTLLAALLPRSPQGALCAMGLARSTNSVRHTFAAVPGRYGPLWPAGGLARFTNPLRRTFPDVAAEGAMAGDRAGPLY